jgi:hypothetical protein
MLRAGSVAFCLTFIALMFINLTRRLGSPWFTAYVGDVLHARLILVAAVPVVGLFALRKKPATVKLLLRNDV